MRVVVHHDTHDYLHYHDHDDQGVEMDQSLMRGKHHDTHDDQQDHYESHHVMTSNHHNQGVEVDQPVMRGNERMVEHHDRSHTHTSQSEV